ncbi:hypothetical protein [Salipaludibacillus aurantiacus]|nr:hypothetical protein [Salipaludibacillus aurantiacus]
MNLKKAFNADPLQTASFRGQGFSFLESKKRCPGDLQLLLSPLE